MSRYLLGLMILAGFLLPAASASAQEGAAFPVPAGAVSAGYVARWDDGQGQAERYGQGWQSQVVFNVNRWFGIAGEISGTYDQKDPSFLGRRVGRYAYLGGPRFFTQRGRLMPFAQLLAGGQFDDVRNWFNTGVALQPGAGIIVRATEQVGVQVSGDYQRAIYVDDSGPEGRVRVGAGIVFTWGAR